MNERTIQSLRGSSPRTAIQRIGTSIAIAVLLGGVIGACGNGSRGDGCDKEGSLDVCADGICGKGEGGKLQCLQVCQRQEDCLSDEVCGAVENTTDKACHPTGGGED